MLNIAICDDVKTDIETIRKNILKVKKNELQNIEYHIFEYNSGEAFLQAVQNHDFDVVFMDVQLGGISGKEAAQRLRKCDEKSVLCIVSRNETPVPSDFELDTYRYIMKDNDEEIYRHVGSVLKETVRRKENAFVYCHVKGELVDTVKKLELDHILYISKIKYGSAVHMDDNKVYKVKETLKDMEILLCNNGFGTAHNSYVVNYRKITDFMQYKRILKLENGEILNISRKYKESFLKGFTDLLIRGQ